MINLFLLEFDMNACQPVYCISIKLSGIFFRVFVKLPKAAKTGTKDEDESGRCISSSLLDGPSGPADQAEPRES